MALFKCAVNSLIARHGDSYEDLDYVLKAKFEHENADSAID